MRVVRDAASACSIWRPLSWWVLFGPDLVVSLLAEVHIVFPDEDLQTHISPLLLPLVGVDDVLELVILEHHPLKLILFHLQQDVQVVDLVLQVLLLVLEVKLVLSPAQLPHIVHEFVLGDYLGDPVHIAKQVLFLNDEVVPQVLRLPGVHHPKVRTQLLLVHPIITEEIVRILMLLGGNSPFGGSISFETTGLVAIVAVGGVLLDLVVRSTHEGEAEAFGLVDVVEDPRMGREGLVADVVAGALPEAPLEVQVLVQVVVVRLHVLRIDLRRLLLRDHEQALHVPSTIEFVLGVEVGVWVAVLVCRAFLGGVAGLLLMIRFLHF